MSELERALLQLGDEIDWPPAPEVQVEPVPRTRPWQLVLVGAAATAIVALAAALAIPGARGAILRFLHLGGATIERVSVLPPAPDRPLGSGLGRRVSSDEAKAILGVPFDLPRDVGTPVLHERDGFVSALLAAPAPVLLSESAFPGLVKKLAAVSTSIDAVRIRPGITGLWISGGPHVFVGPEAPPRLAGNVLLWERDGITYRLEGKGMSKARALELASAIVR